MIERYVIRRKLDNMYYRSSRSARNKVGYVIDEEGNLCYLRRGQKKLEENKKNESLYSR